MAVQIDDAVENLVTLPDRQVWHQISDEQLDHLCDDRADKSSSLYFTFLGGAIGATPAGLTTLFEIIFATEKPSVAGYFSLFILISTLAAFLVIRYVSKFANENKSKIAENIRSRKTHTMDFKKP